MVKSAYTEKKKEKYLTAVIEAFDQCHKTVFRS